MDQTTNRDRWDIAQEGRKTDRRIPLLKRTLSRIAGLSLKYIAGLPTCDVTNSFKMYRKSMLDSITIESDGGFEIGMEIVVKAHFAGFKVTEIPSVWMDRESGESRFKIMK